MVIIASNGVTPSTLRLATSQVKQISSTRLLVLPAMTSITATPFRSLSNGNHKSINLSREVDTLHISLKVKDTRCRASLGRILMFKAINILRHTKRQFPWTASKMCHGIMTLASIRTRWQALKIASRLVVASAMALKRVPCQVLSPGKWLIRRHLNSISS